MKKAVFFDIDGTIWDRDLYIPNSTREAIKQLRENGIYTFLCSGRTTAFIKNPDLLGLGFDGLIAGCGTYAAFGEQEILYKSIPPKLVKRTIEILKKYDLPVVLEGKVFQYVEEADFAGDPFLSMLKREIGEKLLGIHENDMKWEISKFSVSIKGKAYTKALEELGQWYDFIAHGDVVVEAVPRGFSKASGIQAVCEHLGIAREDTYAFGDSVNDLEMLKYAACGIAMGNGMEEAKAAADYVTDSLREAGIYKACRHFGLI